MYYNEIEDKYIEANVKGHYLFESASEVKKVLGYELKAREEIRSTRIIRKFGRFIVKFKNKSYNYLYDSGSVG